MKQSMESALVRKEHTVLLPRSQDEILGVVHRALGLDHVESIQVTADDIVITRHVDPDEEVFPAQDQDVLDSEFLLSRISLTELAFDPEEHPYLLVVSAINRLVEVGYAPVAMMAPKLLASDFFGLDFFAKDPSGVERFLGMRVLYHPSSLYSEKLVIVGGPGGTMTQARLGIIIDMGVPSEVG